MKGFIEKFALKGPVLALKGAVLNFLVYVSMAMFMDSPTMEPSFVSMANALGSSAATAFFLGVGALVLYAITRWYVKNPTHTYIFRGICAAMGLVGTVVVVIALAPVVYLIVNAE